MEGKSSESLRRVRNSKEGREGKTELLKVGAGEKEHGLFEGQKEESKVEKRKEQRVKEKGSK